MQPTKLAQMKGVMMDAGWCEVDMLADAVSNCATGPEFADVLIHRIGISTGDLDDDTQAWSLLAQWYDDDFSTPAPF